MESELVIQLQDGNGHFNCEMYQNLPSPQSVYIAICFTDNIASEQLAIDLKSKLINAITNLGGNFTNLRPPCGGTAANFGGCMALSVPDNLKLLIVVSDGTSRTFADNSVLTWSHAILPVFKTGHPVILPYPLNKQQVAFWNNQIEEIIPIIFGLIGISDEDQKIFISYKRSDSEQLAEQLFDKLTREGFEVFLDRFSINPGVNFQNRLFQELSDKAMVLLIESPNYLTSQWVQFEIDFAKKYRLGLLALNIDGSPKTPSIDDEFRRTVGKSDLNSENVLTPTVLEYLLNEIKQQHSIALYRMRNYLNKNITVAINNKGTNTSYDAKGFICVTDHNGLNHKIWATPRPAKVTDYHYSDISKISEHSIIVAPEFQEEKRITLNSWLSRKSGVDFFNEGQLTDLVNLIHP